MPRTKSQDALKPKEEAQRRSRASAKTKRAPKDEEALNLTASSPEVVTTKTVIKATKASKRKSSEVKTQDSEPRCTCGCGCGCGGEETVEGLLPSDDVEILSAFFKALSDPSRLNIVCVLLKYRQLSVGDIAAKINMSVSAVSHQLAILRMRKLVMVKRDGVKNYYALCDDHVAQVIEMAIEHINE